MLDDGRSALRGAATSRGSVWAIALAALVLWCVACSQAGAHAREAGEPGAGASVGTRYFTRFSLRFERDLYRTTNYRTTNGLLLPINTEVELVSMGGRRAVVRILEHDRELTIENIERHTSDSMQAAFAKVFATEPVELSRFSAEEQAAILEGRAIAGMDRTAVLAAMGPPPAVGTMSLQSDEWKYWNTRFTTFFVRFGDDGRVVDIGR